MRALWIIAFLFTCTSCAPFASVKDAKKLPQFVDEDLQLLEPAIIADPVDGGSWWYAPTRKGHPMRNQYQQRKRDRAGRITDEEFRLPGDILPSLYVIQLLPHVDKIDQEDYDIEGYTEIYVDCVRSTNNITMNSVDITIDQASITILNLEDNSHIGMTGFIDEQNTREMITIQTEVQLEQGKKYKISMKFTSILNDQKSGFYRSSYQEGGVTKWLAVSDFESSDARQAFPCFDEPNMKASFSIVLGRSENMTSASNMRQIGSEPIIGKPGYIWDYYETSVKMSTYLVAFLVSEYSDIHSSPELSNVQFRVWARPEAEALTKYSGEIGPKILEFYESYMNVNYPLSKEDFAAIPDKDFTAGAMENWGLITYRESDLLIDPATASASQLQRVAVVNAHELAHQWFGDLVTLDWWNAIWLNEGFASYFEFLGTDAVEPTFGMEDQFVIADLQSIFISDSLETSRPLHFEVSDPKIINNYFDGVAYSKGASVVRMMAGFLGLETLNRGLTRYLTEQSYANGQEDELWQALQDQADEDGIELPASVKEIMDTWIFQMGYPVITVTRNYDDGSVTFTQERFLSRKSSNSTDTHDYRWWVPLTYKTASNPIKVHVDWLSKDETEKTVKDPAFNVQWLLLNIGQQHYYRVAYDDQNYALLAAELEANHASILPTNRAQLLDDAFNLALANIIPYKSAMDLTKYLKHEQEYVPWNSVLGEFNYIDNMLHNQLEYPDWKAHVISLITPYYELVGFQEQPDDAHLTIYSRTDALNWACRMRIADCVNNAKALYASLMTQPDTVVSPNQRTLILRTGVENGGEAEWNYAFEQYKSTGDTTYLVAMTCTRQSNLIYQMLEMMLQPDSGIYSGHINTLFSNIAANPLGNSIALDFLINRWDDIEAGLGTGYFVNFFRYLCDRLNTETELDKMLQMREDHTDILGSSPTVQQGVDVIVFNIDWMKNNQYEIAVWFNPDATTTEGPTTTTTTEVTTKTDATTTTKATTKTDATSTTTKSSTTVTMTTPSGSNTVHNVYIAPLLFVLSVMRWMLH